MICITGDTHAGVDMYKLSRKGLKHSHIELTENDYLIITGDFGFPFSPKDISDFDNGVKGEYTTWMKWLAKRPYKVLFVDGNHDNPDWWSRQPVSEMFGGRVQVHPHAENVIHLMRGEVYEIEGKRFFTFGGAASTDKEWRTEGCSWWKGEEASFEETEHALEVLEGVGYKVDYIVTHTMPQSILSQMPGFRSDIQPCSTAMFLNTVLERVQYDKWFCGHFHIDEALAAKRLFVLYNTIHNLDEFDAILNGENTMYSIKRDV